MKDCRPHLEFHSMVGVAHALDLKAVPAMRSFVDKVRKEKENLPSYTGQRCCCTE